MIRGKGVRISRDGMRAIMKSEGAQRMVNEAAQRVCDGANSMSGLSSHPHGYVVHPRILTVSAHAFVDCGGDTSRFDNHRNDTLVKAFYESQGG